MLVNGYWRIKVHKVYCIKDGVMHHFKSISDLAEFMGCNRNFGSFTYSLNRGKYKGIEIGYLNKTIKNPDSKKVIKQSEIIASLKRENDSLKRSIKMLRNG